MLFFLGLGYASSTPWQKKRSESLNHIPSSLILHSLHTSWTSRRCRCYAFRPKKNPRETRANSIHEKSMKIYMETGENGFIKRYIYSPTQCGSTWSVDGSNSALLLLSHSTASSPCVSPPTHSSRVTDDMPPSPPTATLNISLSLSTALFL